MHSSEEALLKRPSCLISVEAFSSTIAFKEISNLHNPSCSIILVKAALDGADTVEEVGI